MCIYFFIHSSVNRHLGCFHDLANGNSAAMSPGVDVFLNCGFEEAPLLKIFFIAKLFPPLSAFESLSNAWDGG